MLQPAQQTPVSLLYRHSARVTPVAQPRDQWIAFVGKLALEKGVHCLIAAAPELISHVPQARLMLIGDGVARVHLIQMRDALAEGNLDQAAAAMRLASRSSPEPYAEWVAEYWAGLDLDVYRSQALAANLKQSVFFTGYQTATQVAQRLACADLMVIPSLIKEAFPLVSVEALSSGLMFVAPHVGGLAPILDRIAVELEPIGSLAHIHYRPESMIRELIQRVTDLLHYTAAPCRRADVAAMCRNFALKHYDWTNIVSRIESVYVSAIYGQV